MDKPLIKICGMKHNVPQVAALGPDYLGFIFYDKSPRNFEGPIPKIPESTKRVGVFVNTQIERIVKFQARYRLDVIQLHGDETSSYCGDLLKRLDNEIEIWKAVPVSAQTDFEQLRPYLPVTDRFLFDTASILRGGSGKTFDWDLLQSYPFKRPFVLSGGIGPEHSASIRSLMPGGLPLHALDVNSRFETRPGLKEIHTLKRFMDELQC